MSLRLLLAGTSKLKDVVQSNHVLVLLQSEPLIIKAHSLSVLNDDVQDVQNVRLTEASELLRILEFHAKVKT